MKNYLRVTTLFTIASLLLLVLAPVSAESQSRMIVAFDSAVVNDVAQDELLANHGAVKIKSLPIINGAVVLLPSRASEHALKDRAGVLRVEDDVMVYALGKTPAPQPAQVMPWGIDRIDAELVWPSGNTADAVKLAVIDTGISNTHPDLLANIKGGVNAINSLKSWNDDNGHGSHVAGTIGALNNTTGVVGAAPAVDLYAVKVLSRTGSGYLSDVIEGIQWSVQNGMQVINMSLGTSANSQSLHDAVIAAYNAGIVTVAAAGNDYGGPVIYPAAYPEVIAVSATDQNNVLAGFSNVGPEVDLAAPGVSIFSTYKGTGYATASGTSMASPHVAGAAALVLGTAVSSAYDLDLDGKWDPTEVQNKLQNTATDLGAVGFDNQYGHGLVNAFAAVQ